MIDPQKTHPLAGLAQRLQQNSEFMAWALATYRNQENLTEAQLAALLGTNNLTELAICRQPNPAQPDFGERVRKLAARTGVDTLKLAQLLRQVSTFHKFRNLEQPQSASGWLAAARDREEGISEETDDELN